MLDKLPNRSKPKKKTSVNKNQSIHLASLSFTLPLLLPRKSNAHK